MQNITIRKMRLFLAVIEEGSFSKAAKKENISQPASSIVINEVEETIGCTLFERNGSVRKALVTPAGQKVADAFHRIIHGYDRELSGLTDITAPKRRVHRLMIQNGLASSLSKTFIERIYSMVGPSELEIDTLERSQILDRVKTEKTSIGVMDGEESGVGLDWRHICDYRLVLLSMSAAVAPRASNGRLRWSEIPRDSYIAGGLDPRIYRKVLNRLDLCNASEPPLSLTGAQAIAHAMIVSGRPCIAPHCLAPAIQKIAPCDVHDLASDEIRNQVALCASIGAFNDCKTSALRDVSTFIEPQECRAAG